MNDMVCVERLLHSVELKLNYAEQCSRGFGLAGGGFNFCAKVGTTP